LVIKNRYPIVSKQIKRELFAVNDKRIEEAVEEMKKIVEKSFLKLN